MKKIKLILIFMFILLFPTISVYAVTVEGNIDPGSGSFSGYSGECTDKACWPTPNGDKAIRGMRVSLISSDGTQKCSKDFVFNSRTVANNINGEKYYSSSSKGNKISYKKGKLSLSTGNNTVSVNYYNLDNYTSFFGVDDYNGSILTDNLNVSSYSNLKSIISNLGCSYSSDDYAVVEPLTIVKSDGKYYYGTIYELASILGNKSGLRSVFRSMGNAITLRSNALGFNTSTTCNNYSSSGGGNLPGCVTNWTYQGMGLYKLSDIGFANYKITITKQDTRGYPISGVSISLSGNGVSKSGTTNANGVVVFEGLPKATEAYQIIETVPAGYYSNIASLYYFDYNAKTIPGGKAITSTVYNSSNRQLYWNINTLESDRSFVIKNTSLSNKLKIIKNDQNGNPISNVSFTISGNGITSKTLKTNSNGELIFEDLPTLLPGHSYLLTETVPTGYIVSSSVLDYGTGRRAPDSINSNVVSWNIHTLNSDRTFTIINQKNYPTLTINKKDENNNSLTGAKFQVCYNVLSLYGYNDQCSEIDMTAKSSYTLGTNFFEEVTNYADGETAKIVIKETQAPEGYVKSNSTYTYTYNPNTQSLSGSSNPLVVKNRKQDCEYDFNALSAQDKQSLVKRFEIYEKYASENKYYTNLLNLDIKTVEDGVCAKKNCNQNASKGCVSLNVDNNSWLNDNENFSCYDFTFTPQSQTNQLYCFFNFDLQNLFSGSPQKGNYSFGQVKAGQMIVKTTQAAKLTLNVNCFSRSIISDLTGEGIDTGTYLSDYIEKIELGGEALSFKDEKVKVKYSYQNDTINNGYIYTNQYEVIYELPTIYSQLLSGKIDGDSTDYYRNLGSGIISKLNSTAGTYYLPYTIYLGDKFINSENKSYSKLGTSVSSNSCSYEIEEEIIKAGELNLEFRLIDGSVSDGSQSSAINLFPGKDGVGRTIGSNWCKENITDCASNNKLTYDEINMDPVINGINSYGVKPSDGSTYKAKYTIELDASTIQKIRNYNDSVSYDEYDLTCDDKGNCEKSKFLLDTNIWNSDNLEIIEDESARRR